MLETWVRTWVHGAFALLSSALPRSALGRFEGRCPAGKRPSEMRFAGGQGFEPRFTASKAAVLPLDDPPMAALYNQMVGSEMRERATLPA